MVVVVEEDYLTFALRPATDDNWQCEDHIKVTGDILA